MLNILFIGIKDSDIPIYEKIRSKVEKKYINLYDFKDTSIRVNYYDIALILSDNLNKSKLRKIVERLRLYSVKEIFFAGFTPPSVYVARYVAEGSLYFDLPLAEEHFIHTIDAIAMEKAKFAYSSSKESPLDKFIGSSRAILNMKETILKYKNSNIPIIITGESGTGKEIVASIFHELWHGHKTYKPKFESWNSAAIPETIAESELFGVNKGAFTDARESREGAFERANGGTLFLDEIADMPISIQTKLLRVLESNEVQRVGGRKKIKINIKFICATHRDLKELREKQAFRNDFFYRIAGLILHIPPLRERETDFLEISLSYLKRYNKTLSYYAIDKLYEQSWKGNVRELIWTLERARTLSGNRDKIHEEDIVFFE